MQPEEKRPNPFEDHIESDLFDVSELETVTDDSPLNQQLQRLLNTLPQPLDYRVWEEELDDYQKQLCAYLTNAIIERVWRPNHAEELSDFSDDDLLLLLTVPLSLGMIAQQRLHSTTPPPPDFRTRLLDTLDDLPTRSRWRSKLYQQFQRWRLGVRRWWQRVLRQNNS
jgi:hypothetical protein